MNKAAEQRATEGTGEIEEATEEEEVTMGEGGFLRTGNHNRLRRGSSKLRKMTNASHHNQNEQSGTLAKPASSSSTSSSLRPADQQPSSPSSSSLPLAPLPLSPAQKASLQLAKETKSATEHDTNPLSPIEHAKRLAAYRAVDAHVKPHHRVIGIGSGSTVPYVVDRILAQGEEANKKRWFVPTGFQSKELIVSASLNLGDVDQFPSIDVTIDGADECDLALNCIKGGGGCHLREKVLAEAADEFVLVADHRKNSQLLGQNWTKGIPIEVPMFAYSKVLANLEKMPGCIEPSLRMGKAKAGPVVTDNSNFIIDAIFDEAHMREPEALLTKIKMLTGVVEVGLFVGMAKAAYFGNEDGSVTVRWSDGQEETLKEGQEAEITAEMIDQNQTPAEALLYVNGADSPSIEATPEALKAKLESLNLA